MRLGVFGGSFDPVHYGHLRAADWSLSAFRLDRVLLVPARRSPLKSACHAPDLDRLAMLRLAAAGHPGFAVEPCELEREPPSYTVDTLRELARRFPDDSFTLIIGSDASRDLGKWREIDRIRSLAELRVLARPGESGDGSSLPFEGLALSATTIRETVRQGGSIRYLTPEPVRLYIEEKGLYK